MKYAFTNGIILDGTKNMDPLEGKTILVSDDHIVDIIDEEATEDMEKMALLTPSEDEYLKTGVFTLTKNRIGWLLILMITSTFTGQIIEGFENQLATIAGLTACIPMLMGTGGNSGSQASVTVIRGLSLGEIDVRDILRVLWKEIRVSVLCGVSLAVACFVKIIFIDGMLLKTPGVTNNVALVVALTLCLTVICAKVIGCVLPIIAKKMKLDPAVMASPFITTVVDGVSLLVYFGIAKAFLPELM